MNNQQANKNKIEIRIVTSLGKILTLQLSSTNFKEEFRLFVQQHSLSQHQTYEMKMAITSKLIQLANREQSQSTNQPKLKPQPKLQEDNVKNNILKHQGIQTQPYQVQVKPVMYHPVIDKNIIHHNQSMQSIEKDSLEDQFLSFRDQKIQGKINKKGQKEFTSNLNNQKTHKKHNHKQIDNYQKETKIKDQYCKSKSKSPSLSPVFRRLYNSPTASFSSKKNKEINKTQENDFLQVQKYQLNNSLKRTTDSFFTDLFHHNTVSSSRKNYVPKEHISEPQLIQNQRLKSKSAKRIGEFWHQYPSQWISGSRCQMKVQLKKREKEKENQILRQQQIKKRMFDDDKKIKQSPIKQDTYKSRSCDKCNPKTPPKPKQIVGQSIKKQFKNKQVRPYLSNLLQESYNQFVKDLPKN